MHYRSGHNREILRAKYDSQEKDMSSLQIRKITPGFGAEITGIDLTRPLTPDQEADIVSAIAEYGVCVYPHTGLTDQTHIWFSRMFGNLWTIGGQATRPSRFAYPHLFEAGNLSPDGSISMDEMARKRRKGDRLWHTDSSFTKERTTYSLLLAHEVPAEGGETGFADMRGAYDALPQSMKDRIEHLEAEHSYNYSRMLAGFPITEEEVEAGMIARHKLVHIHPGSGRKSLYIASHALRITGMEKEEGRALLRELLAFATQPQFTFNHYWEPGDLVIWDNFSTMHRGGDYDDLNHRRDMRRTTVMAYPPPPVVLDPRFRDRFDPAQFEAMVDA
jgi:alpha-ketoglutarate-dependent 2,4-dichlorophenoxyacetate dioxygenase